MNAEETTRAFFEAWQRQDKIEMYRLVTLSQHEATEESIRKWHSRSPKKREPQPPMSILELLEARFLPRRLISFQPGRPLEISAVVVDQDVTVEYELSGQQVREVIIVRLICETAPYRPSPVGTWGVNLTSLTRVKSTQRL